MTPEEYCREKAGRGSNLHYSLLFLALDMRRALTAVHALQRELAEVTEKCSDLDLARRTLAWWRDEIDASFRGTPGHPVGRALAPAIRSFDLPEPPFHALLSGMETATALRRYATFDELKAQGEQLAAPLGLLSARILGYRDSRTPEWARALTASLWLADLIRDVGEDARRGRIYLPSEDLARFRVSEADILNGTESAAFSALMAFEVERARKLLHAALALLPAADRRPQTPTLILVALADAILDEIARDGYRVLKRRVALTPLRKLWIAWRTERRERRRRRPAMRS